MKKLIALICMTLLMAGLLSGCAKHNHCTVQFLGSESVELVSNDDGFDSIKVEDNTLKVEASKKGTYNVVLLIDGNEETVTITRSKDGFAVETTAPYDIVSSVE